MPRTVLAALAAASLLLLAAGAARADDVRIAATWDEALAEAARRNVPILVVLQKEGAAPFINHFHNAAFAQFLNDRAIVLVGHRPNGHEPATRPVRGGDRREKREEAYCPAYPSITCAVHDELYNTYAGRFDYQDLPAAFVCGVNGRARETGIERLGPPAIMEKINQTQLALGEGVFGSELERLERKLAKGDEKLAEDKLGPALRVYLDELEGAQKALLRSLCEERIARLDARALELIEAARALEGKERSDTLHRIERELRGRPAGERAAAVIAELGL